MKKVILPVGILVLTLLLQACSGGDPVEPNRYAQTDQFVSLMVANIEKDAALQFVADIDHSRLGHEAGSPMPPSRALIFSNRQLESELIELNPLVALDLPLRILAYESGSSQENNVIFNSFEYITSRYGLSGDKVPEFAVRYREAMDTALAGIPKDSLRSFSDDAMRPNGIISIESPFGFDETVARIRAAIDSQDDTMYFGTVDFQENANALGIDLMPSFMILFGAPGPGGKAMAAAPTLGLDGFCQKLLIWQDEEGITRLSFNDLIALAHRQQVTIPVALRVINLRLANVFEKALQAE